MFVAIYPLFWAQSIFSFVRSLLNVACCVVTCRHHHIAKVSVYRSPSFPSAICIAELRYVHVVTFVIPCLLYCNGWRL